MPAVESKPLKMASPDYFSFGFAAIVALGGVIGYAKAGKFLLIISPSISTHKQFFEVT